MHIYIRLCSPISDSTFHAKPRKNTLDMAKMKLKLRKYLVYLTAFILFLLFSRNYVHIHMTPIPTPPAMYKPLHLWTTVKYHKTPGIQPINTTVESPPEKVTAETKLPYLPLDTSDHIRAHSHRNTAISKRQIYADRQKLWPFLTASWNYSTSVNGSVFRYLDDFRNPCWIEELPPKYSYTTNAFVKYLKKYSDSVKQYATVRNAFASMEKVLDRRRAEGKTWRFRCLPAVYLAGVHHAGNYRHLFNILLIY